MTKRPFYKYLYSAAFLLLFFTSCTAPRGIINSGKVTTQGQFKVGMDYGFNLASEPLGELNDIAKAAVDAATSQEEVVFDDQIDLFARAITAYAIDPVGAAYDLYIRYGIVPRLDAGYRYASGAHAFDAMYQFKGSTGTPTNPGAEGIYGSVGLQFSTQSLNIGDQFYLERINNLLKFHADRKDIIIPLIFSKSFGTEEEMGSIAWGVVYNHTFIDYGFEPGRLVKRLEDNTTVKVEGVSQKNNFSSFGAFLNARIGYKYIYVVPALTIYYQNYGTYKLLEGREYSYSGMTFIPSIGIQARFGGKK